MRSVGEMVGRSKLEEAISPHLRRGTARARVRAGVSGSVRVRDRVRVGVRVRVTVTVTVTVRARVRVRVRVGVRVRVARVGPPCPLTRSCARHPCPRSRAPGSGQA